MTDAIRHDYGLPADDEALDVIDLAIVRALVPVIVARIREELEKERQEALHQQERPAV